MVANLNVALLPELVLGSISDCLVVVIDTLRFTTTATLAVASGARSVTTVREIESARAIAAGTLSQDRDTSFQKAKLCGERNCNRIDGFDFGNSPSEYETGSIDGCDLVFSTTNGTKAVAAASGAADLFLGSLVNRAAIVSRICQWSQKHTGPILLSCSGTDGEVTLEDVWTAGAIIEGLLTKMSVRLSSDSAKLAYHSWQVLNQKDRTGSREIEGQVAGEQFRLIASKLATTAGGANLVEAGYAADLTTAAKLDSTEVVLSRIWQKDVAIAGKKSDMATRFEAFRESAAL